MEYAKYTLSVGVYEEKMVLIVVSFFLFFIKIGCAEESSFQKLIFDDTIACIKLRDEKSYKKVIEKHVHFFETGNIVYTQHYNKNGFQLLTLISNPDRKYEVIRYEVSKLDKPFLQDHNILKKIDVFKTGSGVRLGISEKDLQKILGEPTEINTNEDNITEIVYSSEQDSRFEKSKYHSRYRFYKGCLFEFSAGYCHALG